MEDLNSVQEKIGDCADRIAFVRDSLAAGVGYISEDGLAGINSVLNSIEDDLRQTEKELSKGDGEVASV